MKKRLAQWFLLVAKRLDDEINIENAKVVEDYDARKLGLTYEISRNDIKAFRFKDGARMSLREGKRCVVNEARKNIRKHIIGCIDANRLIEYHVEKKDDGFRVSGELKVYIPKPNTDGEAKET